MDIVTLEKEKMDEIKPLWERLNALHAQMSENFKDHFQIFSFEKRKAKLLQKPALRIFTAMESDSYVGYCIASVDGEMGEIDSLFILPEYRGQKTGHQLMDAALSWLGEQACHHIDLVVAEGNERVFSFYEKYGFKKRATIMRIKTG